MKNPLIRVFKKQQHCCDIELRPVNSGVLKKSSDIGIFFVSVKEKYSFMELQYFLEITPSIHGIPIGRYSLTTSIYTDFDTIFYVLNKLPFPWNIDIANSVENTPYIVPKDLII